MDRSNAVRRTLIKRIGLNLAIFAGGGVMFAGSELSCAGFGSDVLFSSIDMCFLFDCNNGAIGGLIDFCSDVVITDPAAGAAGGNFFTDCP
jgi:hypothetical protein